MGPETDSMAFKVRELLKDVKLDPSTMKLLDQAVSSVVEVIRCIPDSAVGADAAPGFVRDLDVLPEKIAFTFKAPESIVVAGSHSIRSIAKPDVNVDLLVRMPRKCFLEKDYMNHRYHARRCLYLHVVKEHLKSSPAVRRASWSTLQNEARKPVLLVFPALELIELPGFFIRIIPCATSVFNVSRLSLTRNNVRAVNEGGITRATPRYNSSILEDMFLEDNAEFIRKTFHGWRSLEEALILLKVWARNRSSIYAHDCLNGFLMSIILSLLAVGNGGKLINKSMDALQIFRVSLQFIATSTSWIKGLSLKAPGHLSEEEMELHRQLFDVVISDVSGCANLAFRMRRTAILELRDEAALTLDCMNQCRDGGFEEIFMTKVDFPAKFDLVMRINMKGLRKFDGSRFCLDGELSQTYEEELHSLLIRALNDRAKLVRLAWRSTPFGWDVVDGFSQFGREPMLVGVLFSSFEKISRVVDIGPNADDKAENFWGEKAELRRFKDGTIAESTVWECQLWKRHQIVKRITQHVLSKHLSLSNDDVVQIVDQLDFSLLHGAHDPISFSGTLMGAFEILSKRLRQLDGLPLRYLVCSLWTQLTKRSSLEGSGLWPLDEVAIEKTKTAWLLEIARRLQDGLDVFCVATEDEVDVLISGYAFLGNGVVKGVSSSDRELFLRSQHSSMINGLLGRYSVYGPVVRLAKRWIASHFFSSFLAEEAVELLVAHLFLMPLPFCAPCSRTTGFLRFLRLLANYDWTFSPLIVDINNDLTLEDKKQINEAFILSRKSYEENAHDIEPAMFLATSYDKASQAWTSSSPRTPVLRRLVSYARSSADLMTNLILRDQPSPYTWECLFRTPLNNYDAVVLLHQERLSYPQRKHVTEGRSSAAFHPYLLLKETNSLEAARSSLMVGFDPTRCFVEDLKKEFPDTFKVWYDSLGKRERDEVSDKNSGDPSSLLKEVGEVGKGFVRSVYLLKAPRRHQP
ncbi:unnamed protein product [Spirodela intermedia]|uniref:Uncharacterized protein n=1 Tax=Spirodela intermedia TaxID=51605 RepID=A0A7I8I7H7_SPIIN|nr:unnamed protein product [Spirodela intermedia]CAA6653510.1 unnamed protein product [Spirodela intermedia]